jgi:hypothetical protein
MSRDVQLSKPEDTIRSAAALMKKSMLVYCRTENDELIGMITDRDIAIRGVAEGKGQTIAKHRFERLADGQNMIEALTPKRSDQALRLVRDRKPPRLDFPASSRPAPVQP